MPPDQAQAIDGIALHTYSGPFENIRFVDHQYSHWKLAFTERRCMLDETPEDAAHIAFGTIGNFLVRHGAGFLAMWNLALDEAGKPNQIGADGRRGVVTIQHETGEVKRNLEYFMLRNYGQDVPVGSRLIRSSNYTTFGYDGGLGSVAFETPDGSLSAIVFNPTGEPIEAAVTVKGQGASWQRIAVPAWGTVTLRKANAPVNESIVPDDDEFEIVYTKPGIADDVAPAKEAARQHA